MRQKRRRWVCWNAAHRLRGAKAAGARPRSTAVSWCTAVARHIEACALARRGAGLRVCMMGGCTRLRGVACMYVLVSLMAAMA